MFFAVVHPCRVCSVPVRSRRAVAGSGVVWSGLGLSSRFAPIVCLQKLSWTGSCIRHRNVVFRHDARHVLYRAVV